MKAISASLVILAGAFLLLGGAFIRHSDTQLFVQIAGCGVGIAGLWGWFKAMTQKPADPS